MYELIDFGDGRKLERFGPWLLDRPCPAADRPKNNRAAWQAATARFVGRRAGEGRWNPAPDHWTTQELAWSAPMPAAYPFTLQLAPLPSGQIGVFPEQLANWKWLARKVAAAPKPLRVLNMFAYTGGSTLAAAAAGAEVTHVDAARSVVTRARGNAAASNLADRPIRWIVEDALLYCRREQKRGKQYDAVILDPPTFGRGPADQSWSIERDLPRLLEVCGELTRERRRFMLATCHTPSIGPAELSAYVSDAVIGHCGEPPATDALTLQAADARTLPSGLYARWPR